MVTFILGIILENGRNRDIQCCKHIAGKDFSHLSYHIFNRESSTTVTDINTTVMLLKSCVLFQVD